jgi:hypothetical protein
MFINFDSSSRWMDKRQRPIWLGSIFTQFPHFEGEFLGEDLNGGKVDRVLEVLSDSTTAEYQAVCNTYIKALNRDLSVLTSDNASFDAKRETYVAKNSLTGNPLWC